MSNLWDLHTSAEFEQKDIEAIMDTMIANPVVNHILTMTGGVGAVEVRHFYANDFITGHPCDTQAIPIARTIGENRLVDELIHTFTHSIEMPWILPGVPPTGKEVKIALVVVVEFCSGKISSERIYWDQTSVLAQIGLIDSQNLPATKAESAQKVLTLKKEHLS